VMMSMLCNCCVRELLILARTWFAFGLPSKPGVTTTKHRKILKVKPEVTTSHTSEETGTIDFETC
jgi:hypothetical protein